MFLNGEMDLLPEVVGSNLFTKPISDYGKNA